MKILSLPIWSLNGKSYAFLRWLDNTKPSKTALIKTEANKFTFSLN